MSLLGKEDVSGVEEGGGQEGRVEDVVGEILQAGRDEVCFLSLVFVGIGFSSLVSFRRLK